MKKKAFAPIWVLLCILIILFIFIFSWQLKTNSALRRDFTKKRKELKAVQSSGRRLEQLEKQSQELGQKKEAQELRVSAAEKEPLGLIKTITRLGSKKGFRRTSFKLRSSSVLADQSVSGPGAGLSPLYFAMVCEGTYPQLLEFLKELTSLERVVAVEKIEVKRGKDILPYQQITISFVTYTFLTQ